MSAILQQPSGLAPAPVHILYMIDELCEMGGAERMLLNTIRLLPKDRFRCSLITFKMDPALRGSNKLPCPYHIFPLGSTHDWNALKVAWSLREFIRNENVKIVHTFFETSDLWGGLISKTAGNPVLVSSRRDMGILRSAKHDVGYRIMNPWFDLVVTVSEEVRRFCIQKDCLPPEKVCTLHNGLELENIFKTNGTEDLRAHLRLDPAAPVITTVGHIRRVKGIDVLVQTAERVTREFPKALFLIVGRNSEPQYFKQIEAMVAKAGLQENIRFVGESDDIFPFLKMSDIFFLPSRSEGFSNALIEAMACSLPCVATRVGGNGEAVEEGNSGYLVENEDAQTAAERITTLLRNPDRAREMGRAGREIVSRKFTADAMIGHLVEIYGRLLGRSQN